jgi:uncharacterized protein
MTTMRALLDANILISYLLTPESGTIAQVVDAGISGRYTLLLPEELLSEFVEKARAKPYLAERIAVEELRELAEVLTEMSEAIPRISGEIPAVTRDPKDDYLLAYALVGQADYLVTGDSDLLVLRQIESGDGAVARIVTPRAFAEIIGVESSSD